VSDNRSLPIRERGFEHYKDEIARLHSVIKQRQTKDLDTIEEHREPLSIEEKKEVTILLSWGGPSDGFKIWLDKQGEVLEGYYFFADWFEYEEYRLSDHELDSVLEVYPIEAF
jgi:hypothetical protein